MRLGQEFGYIDFRAVLIMIQWFLIMTFTTDRCLLFDFGYLT